MNNFLEDVGLIAIFFSIVYVYLKILDYYELKRLEVHEDKKVYIAADKFVHGAPYDEVKDILASCFDFDEQDAETIWLLSITHITDKDGGYRAFIRSVNEVVGKSIYDERYLTHKTGHDDNTISSTPEQSMPSRSCRFKIK